MGEQALKWWRRLTIDEHERIVARYFPDVAFPVISTSSIQIERMFNSEMEW